MAREEMEGMKIGLIVRPPSEDDMAAVGIGDTHVDMLLVHIAQTILSCGGDIVFVDDSKACGRLFDPLMNMAFAYTATGKLRRPRLTFRMGLTFKEYFDTLSTPTEGPIDHFFDVVVTDNPWSDITALVVVGGNKETDQIFIHQALLSAGTRNLPIYLCGGYKGVSQQYYSLRKDVVFLGESLSNNGLTDEQMEDLATSYFNDDIRRLIRTGLINTKKKG